MLHLCTMMFFSALAVAAVAVLAATLAEGWRDARQALGLDRPAAALPRPVRGRIRPVRTMRAASVRPRLRAAA